MKMSNGFSNGASYYTNAEEVEEVDEDNETQLKRELEEGNFSNFQISEEAVKKLLKRGVKHLFPTQTKTFDAIFEGKDAIVQARTGTGKTLAFSLPVVEKMATKTPRTKGGRTPRVLVMAPTRELARQIGEDFESVSDLKVLCVYGGVPYEKQESVIRAGVDVIVGTPGRLLDFLDSGKLSLVKLRHVVLDEVDRMLDMGFSEPVERILAYGFEDREGKKPQMLIFSATLPDWVLTTARKYMDEEKMTRVDLVGRQANQTSTTVQHLAIKCSYHNRASTLGDILSVYSGQHGRAMVFCHTKADADSLAVSKEIKQDCHVLHGDIPQAKREIVLDGFRKGKYQVLITTDVAARGLDIPEVDLVVQIQPPKDVDSYIHRSGRTGRAGRTGTCLCFYKPQEEYDLNAVERRAKIAFKRIGAPTPEDIIKAGGEDSIRSLDKVEAKTLELFRETAEKLIESRGAATALAAALAVISGSTEVQSRSLLNSQQGSTTYLFTTNMKMNSVGYAWRALERQLGDTKEKIRGMRMCKDEMSCAFDLPTELDSYIDDHWQDGRYDSLAKATELPELMESKGFSSGGGARCC